MHAHDMPEAPADLRLPLIVLVTERMRVVVVEGMPDPEDFIDMIRRMLQEEKVLPSPLH